MIWTAAILFALAASDDKEAEDAISKFKLEVRSPEPSLRVEAVRELAKVQHDKVIRVLGNVLATGDRAVQVAAAKALGGFKDRKPKAVLVLAEAASLNPRDPELAIAILSALRDLRDKTALATAYRFLEDKDGKIAEAAIGITEVIKSRDSVEPLIKLMKRLIGAGDGVSSGDGSFDAPPDPRLQERARLLNLSAEKALKAITGESFSGPREWEGWWKRNGAAFKVKE
jgi:hypothetical protein